MDLDAFVATHQGSWNRLAELSSRARKLSTMDPRELDELVALHQRVGSHLAQARVRFRADDALVDRLTYLVADSHGVLHGRRKIDVRAAVSRFLAITFPAAVWNIRWCIAASALLMLVPWAVMQVWIGISPDAFDLTTDPATRAAYIETDFENYYSSQPAQNFAGQVFLNNVRVGILAFAAGIAAGLLLGK